MTDRAGRAANLDATMDTATIETVVVASQEKSDNVVSDYVKEKVQQPGGVYDRKGPLTLLELPADILRLIVKEVKHTNDLTALALTCSVLHNLAVPLIYSRFDIVWPDGNMTSSEAKSVDALTYGLSTLCLGSSFARTTRRLYNPASRPLSRFINNDHAKYTKKFSLGNGPDDWVAEYMITKESGKMLGTLVAIAIAKMKNLEAFVWDMPTGVMSDIFMALSSLADQPDDCKLSRVWIRWHDNSESHLGLQTSMPNSIGGTAHVPEGAQLTPVGILLPAHASHPIPRAPVSYADYHCEYPTFSVLPALKSLSVLDIDELGYLDEMATLIERSKNTLQELRVGISSKAAGKNFVQTWDGPGLRQVDHRARWPGESAIGERRLGGVLGVLVGKVYDIKKIRPSKTKDPRVMAEEETVTLDSSWPSVTPVTADLQTEINNLAPTNTSVQSSITVDQRLQGNASPRTHASMRGPRTSKSTQSGRRRLEGKLKLQTLELERVMLSMQVCRHAFDWSVLSNLTLLGCAQSHMLWKILRKQFQPTPISTGYGISSNSKPPAPDAPLQYHLALKHIHTDATSPDLLAFIKETLAPNTLEAIFLQDRMRDGPPPVQLGMIFKALKRHRSSLRKLLLDSSAADQSETRIRWQNWALTTEFMLYITSGRMCNLRELAVSLHYADWHTFLQRLPNMPQLHSINIPHIANYVTTTFEPRELAHQIVDILTLRPEVRLCYIGIGSKCFEVLETTRDAMGRDGLSGGGSGYDDGTGDVTQDGGGTNGLSGVDHEDEEDEDEELTSEEEEDDDDEEDEDDDDDEVEDSDDDDNTPTTTEDLDDGDGDGGADGDAGGSGEAADDSDDSDDDSFVEPDGGRVRLRFREILFYDDKVAVFKARHGRL